MWLQLKWLAPMDHWMESNPTQAHICPGNHYFQRLCKTGFVVDWLSLANHCAWVCCSWYLLGFLPCMSLSCYWTDTRKRGFLWLLLWCYRMGSASLHCAFRKSWDPCFYSNITMTSTMTDSNLKRKGFVSAYSPMEQLGRSWKLMHRSQLIAAHGLAVSAFSKYPGPAKG